MPGKQVRISVVRCVMYAMSMLQAAGATRAAGKVHAHAGQRLSAMCTLARGHTVACGQHLLSALYWKQFICLLRSSCCCLAALEALIVDMQDPSSLQRCTCLDKQLTASALSCCLLRPINGGMFELGALQAAVMRRRGSRSDPVSEDDIIRAIKKLKVGSSSRMHVTLASLCNSWGNADAKCACALMLG